MSQKSLEVIQISKDFSMTRFEVEGILLAFSVFGLGILKPPWG